MLWHTIEACVRYNEENLHKKAPAKGTIRSLHLRAATMFCKSILANQPNSLWRCCSGMSQDAEECFSKGLNIKEYYLLQFVPGKLQGISIPLTLPTNHLRQSHAMTTPSLCFSFFFSFLFLIRIFFLPRCPLLSSPFPRLHRSIHPSI